MTNLDILWWFVLGCLLGWMGLWFFDKLFLRDGEVAGIRADREISVANAELAGARDRLTRAEQESVLLKSDLVAHNDQGDVLRTEIAMFRNERNSLQSDLSTELARVRTLQQEIDSSRKLAAERSDEIARLEQMILELQQDRDTARNWAQAKDTDLATTTNSHDQMKDELARANALLAVADKRITAIQNQMRTVRAKAASGRPISAREQLRMTGRMRRLSVMQNTIDALAAADQARRKSAGKGAEGGGS